MRTRTHTHTHTHTQDLGERGDRCGGEEAFKLWHKGSIIFYSYGAIVDAFAGSIRQW